MGPTPSIVSNSSKDALLNFSISPLKYFSNNLAICSPTFLMPNPYTKRGNDVFFEFLIALIKLSADFSPNLSRPSSFFFC